MRQPKTQYAKPREVAAKWHLVDADGQVLGRLASEIASTVRGKYNTNFTPSVHTGDFVVVINADKVRVTGNKMTDKKYYRHTGYPGGIKETSFGEQLEKDSTRVIMAAVKGMLPKNRLGAQMLKKVKVFATDKHPHEAQLADQTKTGKKG